MLSLPDTWISRSLRASQDTSRRNARAAMMVLAARRREREDVERYLARLPQQRGVAPGSRGSAR